MTHLFHVFDISRQCFFQSRLSYGIVNLMPLVPGHVLVIPRRIVPRFKDLHPDEVADLYISAQTIGKVIEKEFKAEALTIAMQDGKLAGQSVPHVHVHVMPRRQADFDPLDKIYDVLQEQGAEGATSETVARSANARLKMDVERKPRTASEMMEEAGMSLTGPPCFANVANSQNGSQSSSRLMKGLTGTINRSTQSKKAMSLV